MVGSALNGRANVCFARGKTVDFPWKRFGFGWDGRTSKEPRLPVEIPVRVCKEYVSQNIFFKNISLRACNFTAKRMTGNLNKLKEKYLLITAFN